MVAAVVVGVLLEIQGLLEIQTQLVGRIGNHEN